MRRDQPLGVAWTPTSADGAPRVSTVAQTLWIEIGCTSVLPSSGTCVPRSMIPMLGARLIVHEGTRIVVLLSNVSAIAGVGLVTGTIFGFLALSEQSDFDAMPTADAADRGETFALIADLSFGVAIAAGVTAIVLYAVDRPQPQSEVPPTARRDEGPRFTLAPWASPTAGGAAARIEF